MPVSIVPNDQVLTIGASSFQLNPSPGIPLYQDMARLGPNAILYETISPSMTITVQATGGCPFPSLPELVTSITIIPGEGQGTVGSGCSIVALSEIADRDVPNIPEFLMTRGFNEPLIQYGSITGAPSPTMSLVAPLRGYYGEKYFYDAEYIYASYYRNSQMYDPVDGKVISSFSQDQNRLTSVSLLGGKKVLPFSDIPEGIDTIRDEYFPTPGIPIQLDDVIPLEPGSVLTYGNDYLQKLIPEISSWVKWKPSFIEIMRYNFTLIVTHTCPPFVTIFNGYILINNNWTPAANRLTYYISQQNGFLDEDT
jgi:hypothetical protein